MHGSKSLFGRAGSNPSFCHLEPDILLAKCMHMCKPVWNLVFDSVSRPAFAPPPAPPSPTTLSHTHTPSFTHNFVTHHLSHTTWSHTPSFTHTTLSYILFHAQLCHTPSFTHNFVTHSFTHNFVTHHLSHTSTFVSRGRGGAWRHPPSFGVAGVALLALGWVWWRAWLPLDAAALCVAAVELGDVHLRFTWQAWRLATTTFVWRGQRGTWQHPPSFCMAGVALLALG